MIEDKIRNILIELNKVTDVLGSVVISYPDGIPIATTWEEEIESVTASGLVTSVRMTLDHLYNRFKKSKLSRVYINCDEGNFIIMNAGETALIVTFLATYANVPACSFEIRNAALKIQKILKP